MAAALPWVEKFRPAGLDELVAHEHVVATVARLADEGRLPHLLFYGPPGTGKTSTILALARRMYGPGAGAMVLELNASDDRGIGVVKQRIKEFASTRKIFSSGAKLVVLDEADAMTNAAQAALRRVIEKYARNTRFCLVCNYVSKISPALQSRCTRFRFAPLQQHQISAMVDRVIQAEGVDITEEGKAAVLRLSKGDMRMCLNTLQATHMAYGRVTAENAYLCTGNPTPADVRAVFQRLFNADFVTAFEYVQQAQLEKGLALVDLVREIHGLAVRASLGPRAKALLLTELANVEARLAAGTVERVQLAALVACCQLARADLD